MSFVSGRCVEREVVAGTMAGIEFIAGVLLALFRVAMESFSLARHRKQVMDIPFLKAYT